MGACLCGILSIDNKKSLKVVTSGVYPFKENSPQKIRKCKSSTKLVIKNSKHQVQNLLDTDLKHFKALH